MSPSKPRGRTAGELEGKSIKPESVAANHADTPKLHILVTAKYRRFQGNHANCAGVEFQVTECECGGQRFFVRENFRYDTFTSNSGVRWGLQQGHSVRGINVLELACAPGQFDELSRVVHEADGLKRPVVRNRTFTLRTAPRYFKKK